MRQCSCASSSGSSQCGQDGKTYANECYRLCQGVGVSNITWKFYDTMVLLDRVWVNYVEYLLKLVKIYYYLINDSITNFFVATS